MSRIKSLAKNSLISFSISFCIIAFAEASYRTMKYLTVHTPVSNRRYQAMYIAFDKKVSIETLKKRAKEVGDHLMYKPWIQMGNYDHSGKYSTVISGVRLTNNNSKRNNCQNPTKIWMFGGSTMYGIGVPSSETIPSKLAKIMSENNICIKVTNYGVPYHFSKQETMHFIDKLFETDLIPDIAIFLDGFNDFGKPSPTIRGEPVFTPSLENLIGKSSNPTLKLESSSPINLQLINYLKRKLYQSSKVSLSKSYSYESNINNEENISKVITSRLIKNTRHLGSICNAYKVDCYRFLQPIAAVDYTPPKNDYLTKWVVTKKSKAKVFKNGYKLIRSSKEINKIRGISFYDISSIFKKYDGIPYIDAAHYSPRANEEIASTIFEKIRPSIKK